MNSIPVSAASSSPSRATSSRVSAASLASTGDVCRGPFQATNVCRKPAWIFFSRTPAIARANDCTKSPEGVITWKARTGSFFQSSSSDAFNFLRTTSAASEGSFGGAASRHQQIASCQIWIPACETNRDDAIQKLEVFIKPAKLNAELDRGTCFVAAQPGKLLVKAVLMLQEAGSKLTDAIFPFRLFQIMVPRIRPNFFDEPIMKVSRRQLFDPLIDKLGASLFLLFGVWAMLGIV